MDTQKQEMEMMHKLCQKELHELQVNLSIFLQESERIQKILNGRKVNGKDGRGSTCVNGDGNGAGGAHNMFALLAFDRYMSQVGIVLNMARKFNIHLQINKLPKTVISPAAIGSLEAASTSQSRILQDYIEWTNTKFDQDAENNIFCEDGGSLNEAIGRETTECLLWNKDNLSNSISQEEVMMNKNSSNNLDIMTKLENFLKILLPIKNLTQYKEGHEFLGSITYVFDYKNLVFYIFDLLDYEMLHEFSNEQNLKPIQRSSLTDALFYVSQNNTEMKRERECVWRAVMVPEEGKYAKDAVYLIDFGEIIALTDQCALYKAPLKCSQTSPLAIKCILRGVQNKQNNLTKDHEQCKEALRLNEYKMVQFRVVKREDSVLHLDLIEKPSKEVCKEEHSIDTKPCKTVNSKNSNSSKEVLKEEHSIDNKTFKAIKSKNSNPFLNNTLLFDDDDEEYADNLDPLPLPMSAVYSLTSTPATQTTHVTAQLGDQLQILVTHILNPIAFYAIIENAPCNENKTFSWPDYEISTLQKQMPPPLVNDIVLSQYIKDNYWYRAKIIDILAEKGLYKVFYVDFGNTEIVPLSCLATCTKQQLEDPSRAVLFQLANLALTVSHEDSTSFSAADVCYKKAFEAMVVILLDASLNVEVVERHKDVLMVRLNDQQHTDIPKMLIDLGVVKEI